MVETTRTILICGVFSSRSFMENRPCLAIRISPTCESESLANFSATSLAFVVASSIIDGLSSFKPVKMYSTGLHVFFDPSNMPFDISSRDSESAF